MDKQEQKVDGAGLVVDALPHADLKLLLKFTQEYRIGADDPFYGSVLAARVAFGGAAAAGDAARETREAIKSIRREVLEGARLAGKDIHSSFDLEATTAIGRISSALYNPERPDEGAAGQAVGRVKEALENGTGYAIQRIRTDLTSSRNQAQQTIDSLPEKIREAIQIAANQGAADFTEAARKSVMAASIERFNFTFWVFLAGVLFLLGLGAFGEHFYLENADYISPSKIIMDKHGHPNCFLGQDNQWFCQVSPIPQIPQKQ